MAEPNLETPTANPGLHRAASLLTKYSDWVLGLGVLGLVLTLVSPVPPLVLDLLLAVNITAALLLLLVTMNARKAVELSVFPTLLLFATLFRLGLNVASTRLILSSGDAGAIIGFLAAVFAEILLQQIHHCPKVATFLNIYLEQVAHVVK